ncbi:MAG: hypothetical protein ACXW3Z_14885 [Limisphaerales bacterium]
MKTFSELISWELEQEAKQKVSPLKLAEEDSGGKLSASVLRKLRYLNSASVSKTASGRLSAA